MKMPKLYTEADYENSVIELFRNDLGYEYAYGPDIERDFYSPLYEEVLLDSLYRLNRSLPDDAIQDALLKLKNFENGELVQKNAVFMDYLQNGNIANGVNYPSVSMPRTSAARICVHHKNIKEMLSKILAIVASQGINVAHMQDSSKGEYAYLILDLDEPLGEPALKLIASIAGVIRVRAL